MKLHRGLGLWIVVAVVGASSVGCQCCRKGLVLRGDWSLEINRISHLAANGPQYQPDCTECVPCDEPCGCTDCCTSGCGPCGADGSACRLQGDGGYATSGYGGYGPAAGMHGEYGADGGGHVPPPPNPTPAGNTRFHPVPTRPVFERQVEMTTPVAEGQWAPSAQGKSLPTR